MWPASLQQLAFGKYFDQPIEHVAWPTLLQQLTFGDRFHQPIEKVAWPAALQWLAFGCRFNQPIDGVSWPVSLQRLRLGCDFNQPLQEFTNWPANLTDLHLFLVLAFNLSHRPLAGVQRPTGLRTLTVRRYHDLDGAALAQNVETHVQRFHCSTCVR